MCDAEVIDVLRGLVHPCDVDNIDRTVVICSTRNEYDDVNDRCINRIDAKETVYEALDTDNHGHPLRAADKLTVLKYRERLPNNYFLRSNVYKVKSAWVDTLQIHLKVYVFDRLN